MPGGEVPGGAAPPRLRLVLAISLDGRLALPQGGPSPLGGRNDRRVLEESLAWADGCLIGAETLRIHGSTCLIHHSDLLAGRAEAGRPPQPVAVVVSGSGRWPNDLPFFRQPLRRWWLQGAGADTADPASAEGFEACLNLGPWPETLAELGRRGLHRVLLLGGARLAQALLRENLVDELQLTLVPRVLGGPHAWVPPGGDPLPGTAWRLLEHRALGEGELLLRYDRDPG